MDNTIFTSESVCAGHPDKLCDQISDAILDAVLEQDPEGHVAVETLATYEKVVIAGEVKAHAQVDYEAIARREIKRLGYTHPEFHFTDSSPVEVLVHTQSPEIELGVNKKGAGDQGMMFGYACKETDVLMPLPIMLAHELAAEIDAVREDGTMGYLFPDGKSQVTVSYKDGKPEKITNVVLAVPHQESVAIEDVRKDLYTHVVVPILERRGLSIAKDELVVNGTGVWHAGGPAADTGLTGRKIIVDSYGGYARVGGGAFSGKDPTKVDRSGAYAARYIAKNIVAAGLAQKAEVRLAYIIGLTKPVMQQIETFGTQTTTDAVLQDFVAGLLDTSVQGILDALALRNPIYLPTAAYGHFGRELFPWEQVR